MSLQNVLLTQSLERLIDHERKAGLRPVTTLHRRLEARLDVNALPSVSAKQLRVLAPGNGASAEDVGKFWFVPGYSTVGGPDVVRQD